MIAVEILAPVSGRGLEQGECRVSTVKLKKIESQDGAFPLVFHDVMVSTFKFGGNRRLFGVDIADFVWCRGGTRAIRLPVVCDIPVSDVTRRRLLYTCCLYAASPKTAPSLEALRMCCVRSHNLHIDDPVTDSRPWGTTSRNPKARYSEQAATHVQVKHTSRIPDRE